MPAAQVVVAVAANFTGLVTVLLLSGAVTATVPATAAVVRSAATHINKRHVFMAESPESCFQIAGTLRPECCSRVWLPASHCPKPWFVKSCPARSLNPEPRRVKPASAAGLQKWRSGRELLQNL